MADSWTITYGSPNKSLNQGIALASSNSHFKEQGL
jgi:hypothetical protein